MLFSKNIKAIRDIHTAWLAYLILGESQQSGQNTLADLFAVKNRAELVHTENSCHATQVVLIIGKLEYFSEYFVFSPLYTKGFDKTTNIDGCCLANGKDMID